MLKHNFPDYLRETVSLPPSESPPQETAATDTTQLIANFDALPDKESRERFLEGLDQDRFRQIAKVVKERKAQETKRRSDEISDLL